CSSVASTRAPCDIWRRWPRGWRGRASVPCPRALPRPGCQATRPATTGPGSARPCAAGTGRGKQRVNREPFDGQVAQRAGRTVATHLCRVFPAGIGCPSGKPPLAGVERGGPRRHRMDAACAGRLPRLRDLCGCAVPGGLPAAAEGGRWWCAVADRLLQYTGAGTWAVVPVAASYRVDSTVL